MSADKQSNKQIYLTELKPASSKRRRTEEITLSQLQIDDFHPISNRIDSQSIREIEYISYETEETTDSKMELNILNVAPVDRYLLSLLQHNKLWRLTGTDIIVMCDHKDNEEMQIRQFVIVIIKSLLCTTCQDAECLHATAAQLSIDDDILQDVEAKYCDGLGYFFLNDNSVILVEESIIHSFNCKEGNWYCRTCLKPCNRKSSSLKVLPNSIPGSVECHEKNYETISSTSIPLYLDDSPSIVFDSQLKHGIELPVEIVPDKMFCADGYSFGTPKPARPTKGIIIYTENDVITLPDHQVFKATCTGPCSCISSYDGSSDLLLNLNNHYFIQYSLLYEYSEFMTISRNTLQGFIRAKNRNLRRLGRRGKIHYHIFHHAWNAYLRLINIDYRKSFRYPICKDCPDVVIFDGVTLGTIKEVPPFSIQFENNQLIPPVPQTFIPSKGKRQEMLGYLENGLPAPHFLIFTVS